MISKLGILVYFASFKLISVFCFLKTQYSWHAVQYWFQVYNTVILQFHRSPGAHDNRCTPSYPSPASPIPHPPPPWWPAVCSLELRVCFLLCPFFFFIYLFCFSNSTPISFFNVKLFCLLVLILVLPMSQYCFANSDYRSVSIPQPHSPSLHLFYSSIDNNCSL